MGSLFYIETCVKDNYLVLSLDSVSGERSSGGVSRIRAPLTWQGSHNAVIFTEPEVEQFSEQGSFCSSLKRNRNIPFRKRLQYPSDSFPPATLQ